MATADNLKTVGHCGGITGCVRVYGRRLFCGFGPELAIFDLSRPQKLGRLGSISLDELRLVGDICVAGDYAYVAVGGGLFVVDISDVRWPRAAGFLAPRPQPVGMAYDGAYVYLAVQDDGLLIVDVSEPTNPSIVSRYKPIREKENIYPRVWDVAVANDHAYLEMGGLVVVDVADPRHPRRVAYLDRPVDAFALADDLAVVIGSGTLSVLDISTPAQPATLGSIHVDNWLELNVDMTLDGNLLVVTGADDRGEGHLRLFDIAMPSRPSSLATLPLPGDSVTVGEKHVYATSAYGRSIVVVDVAQPRQPAVCGRYLSPAFVDRVEVAGGTAYTGGDDGFFTVDIGDPAHPVAHGLLYTLQA